MRTLTGTILLTLVCVSGEIFAAENISAIGRLKDLPGKALVQANCIPCHSTAIIAANHLTRAQWDDTIATMQSKNGMWPIAKPIRKLILDYLEKAQRPADAGLAQGKTSPWARPLYSPNPLWE
jgi:hypothetical protein